MEDLGGLEKPKIIRERKPRVKPVIIDLSKLEPNDTPFEKVVAKTEPKEEIIEPNTETEKRGEVTQTARAGQPLVGEPKVLLKNKEVKNRLRLSKDVKQLEMLREKREKH